MDIVESITEDLHLPTEEEINQVGDIPDLFKSNRCQYFTEFMIYVIIYSNVGVQ